MADSCAWADGLVAVDGAYALYRGDGPSAPEQYDAIRATCARNHLALVIHGPDEWHGGEVDKRAFLFERALSIADPSDWFLVIDADEIVEHVDADGLRAVLAATDCDVAMAGLRSREGSRDVIAYRMLFRALPGLTVEKAHYCYTAPGPDGPRYLWALPPGPKRGREPEPAVDVAAFLRVNHRSDTRSPDRERYRELYYRDRDKARIER